MSACSSIECGDLGAVESKCSLRHEKGENQDIEKRISSVQYIPGFETRRRLHSPRLNHASRQCADHLRRLAPRLLVRWSMIRTDSCKRRGIHRWHHPSKNVEIINSPRKMPQINGAPHLFRRKTVANCSFHDVPFRAVRLCFKALTLQIPGPWTHEKSSLPVNVLRVSETFKKCIIALHLLERICRSWMRQHSLRHALVAWFFAFKSERGFGVRDDLFEAERFLVHACSLWYSVS